MRTLDLVVFGYGDEPDRSVVDHCKDGLTDPVAIAHRCIGVQIGLDAAESLIEEIAAHRESTTADRIVAEVLLSLRKSLRHERRAAEDARSRANDQIARADRLAQKSREARHRYLETADALRDLDLTIVKERP